MKLCWIIYFFFINMRKEKKHVNHFLVLQIQGKAPVKCDMCFKTNFWVYLHVTMDFFELIFFFNIVHLTLDNCN